MPDESARCIQRIKVNPGELAAERKLHVTASQVGALIPGSGHPYLTPRALWVEKSGIALPGPDPASAVIERGTELQPVVARMVGKHRPNWKITPADEYVFDPTLRLGASPDFYVTTDDGKRGVLETKTVASMQFKKHWNEMPPAWILAQPLVPAMLLDLDFAAVGALEIGDFAFATHIFEFERHPTMEQRIRQIVSDFWASVERGEPPQFDYDRDAELIAMLYAVTAPGKTVDLSGDNELPMLLDEREQLITTIRTATDRRTRIEAEVKSKIGDSEIATARGWHLTLKEQRRKEHVVQASSFRQLRVRKEVSP